MKDRQKADGLFLAELVGLIEFVAQAWSVEVFADVGQTLFEFEESALDGFGIGVGDVAPHGEGACAETRHLAEPAAADIFELRGIAYLVFEQSAQSRCGELRQVTEPGDELVVAEGIEIED